MGTPLANTASSAPVKATSAPAPPQVTSKSPAPTPTKAAVTSSAKAPESSTDESADDTESSTTPAPSSTEDKLPARPTLKEDSSSAKVITTTAKPSSTAPGIKSVSSTVRSSSTAAAANANESKGMSNGAIAGIVIVVLLALAAIGGFFAYRHQSKKKRDAQRGWARMDDDVTPFPAREKSSGYYGGSSSPTSGSETRAVALARQNAFYADGTPRPDSTMVNENYAGYGAGRVYGGGYAAASPVASYAMEPTPYSPNSAYPPQSANQYYPPQSEFGTPAQNPFQDPATSPTSASGPRQLVGPGQQYGQQPFSPYHDIPSPVPLGRPEPPSSYDDIAAAEMYSDDRYADDHVAAPVPVAPLVHPYTDASPTLTEPLVRIPSPEPTPLPQLAPMSPLMAPVSLNDEPVPTTRNLIDEDETNRMYGEVAAAAGLQQPYQHGQPLTPLREIPTPQTESRPLPSTPTKAPMPVTPAAPQPSTSADDAYGGI